MIDFAANIWLKKISGELMLNISSIVNVIATSSDYVILPLLRKSLI